MARARHSFYAFVAFLVQSCVFPVLSAIPVAVTNLRVAFVTRNEVSLEWAASAGATMYRVAYKQSDASEFESFGPGAVFQQTNIRIGNLLQDIQYDVQVFAGNSEGWSEDSSLISNSTVTPRNAPEPPINVAEGARTETSITLVWDTPTNPPATHFRVMVSECSKGIGQIECVEGSPCLNDRTVRCSEYALYQEQSHVIEFNSAKAVIRSLEEGTTYFFYVEARNLNINGYQNGGSIPVRLVPRGPYMKAPTNLRVTGVESDSVHLAWDAAIGATHYRVQYRRTVESAWNPTADQTQIVTTATERVITLLSTNFDYAFRVMARDSFEETIGSGTVAWAGDDDGNAELDQHASNIVVATPVDPLVAAPTNLHITGYRATEVHIAWDLVAGADSYVVQVKPTDQPDVVLSFWQDVLAGPGEPLRFATSAAVVTSLVTGTQYEFRVKAYNQHIPTQSYNGYTGPSPAVIATPSDPAPAPDMVQALAEPFENLQRCNGSVCSIQASSTTLAVMLDATSPAVDDIYAGATILFFSGPATDRSAEIAHYNASSQTATLAAPLPVAPGTGAAYQLSRYAVGPNRATVTWVAVPGAERYLVSWKRQRFDDDPWREETVAAPTPSEGACRRGGGAAGEPEHPGLAWVLTECWELTGLAEGVAYEVTVQAGTQHLDWGHASEPTVIMPLHPPDAAPGDPQVVRQDLDSVTMTWTPPRKSPAPTDYYRVSLAAVGPAAGGAGGEPEYETRPDHRVYSFREAGYEIGGLPRGVAVDVRVLAANAAGVFHPALTFRLVTQARDLAVLSARAVHCDSRSYPAQRCNGTHLRLAWTPPPFGRYFRVLYRPANDSSSSFQAVQSPFGPGTVLGPNVTEVALNHTHIPLASVDVAFEYKVVSSHEGAGPFEDVGSRVTIAVTNRAPSRPTNVRLVSKTLSSVTVSWLPSAGGVPVADYFVVQVCYNATIPTANCTLYPNSPPDNKTSAARFTLPHATIDLHNGVKLQADTPYWISVFACALWDEDGNGVQSGSEGCEPDGATLPFAAVPGGLAEPVSGLRVTETYPSVLRLEWERSGRDGHVATMYRILQRRGESTAGAGGSFEEARRVLVRGAFETCDGDFPNFVLRDTCVQMGAGVTYGRSAAQDDCGLELCESSFVGAHVIVTHGPGEGQVREVVELEGADLKYIVLNASYPGIDLRDPVSGTFNVYGRAQYGGPCCPIQSSTVVAYVAGLEEGAAYQFQVMAGTMNEGGFETVGSAVVTGYTIGRPYAVGDLRPLYLVGGDSVRLRWTDPGGPAYCGRRVYRLLGRLANETAWAEMNRTDVTWVNGYIEHTFVTGTGVGGVELTVLGRPAGGAVENTLVVESFCANHLAVANTTFPGVRFLDDARRAGVVGTATNVTIQAPPAGPVLRLAVLYVTHDSLYVTWEPTALADRYRVQVANTTATIVVPLTVSAASSNFSAFSLWPSASRPAVFVNPGTTIRGLESETTTATTMMATSTVFKVRAQAGSQHGNADGEYPAVSEESFGYTPSGPVEDDDLTVWLEEYTSTSITIRWNTTRLSSIDPTNHSRPLYQIYLQRGAGFPWEGSTANAGCSNALWADGEVSIPLTGVCEGVREVNAGGSVLYETSFTGLGAGVQHYVRVHTYNLFSRTAEDVVFTGTVWECICDLPGGDPGDDTCPSHRLLGSSVACTPSLSHLYLEPPASTVDGAYTDLELMVTGGSGQGQTRKIVSYSGPQQRAVVDTPWDVAPDASSEVTLHRAGFVEVGIVTGTWCANGTCTAVTLEAQALRDGATSAASVADMFLELLDGDCIRQFRLITSYQPANRSITLFPALHCDLQPNASYRVHHLSSVSKIVGPIAQSGPPLRTAIPLAVLISHNAMILEWEPTTLCDGGALAIMCVADVYKVQVRQTHDSSHFPTPSEPWERETRTSDARVQFVGLADMSSYEIRVAAKTRLNSLFGDWSDSQFVKLTGGAPSLQSVTEAFDTSRYNDRIQVRWSSTLLPKQIDRYYLTVGKPGFASADVVDSQGRRVVVLDSDVCAFSGNRAECSYFATGLDMGTIYQFQVYSGNMNGFETIGSAVGISSTLSLPVAPIPDLTQVGVVPSLDVDGYAVVMSWSRPTGFPVVSRYYVAQADRSVSFVALPGVIHSTAAQISHTITGLTKGTLYRFRVHGGNDQGPTGFHVDMTTDPTASDILEVTPDTVPGRALVLSADPTTPDKNAMMRLTWQVPRAGAPAQYYQVALFSCFNASVPACVTSDPGVTYRGCTSADKYCSLNPGCDPALRSCYVPCQGASNAGPGAAGVACRFTATEGIVIGLDPATWYRFTVTGHNTAGASEASSVFPASTGTAFVPRTLSLPPAVTSLAITEVTASAVVLEWNAVDPGLCGGSCVYRVTWSPGTDGVSSSEGIRGVRFEHSVSWAGGSVGFEYRVFSGQAADSAYEDFGTGVTLPQAATSFRVTTATENSLSFAWTPSEPADTFQVFMSSGLTFRAASPETSVPAVKIEGLATGLAYSFKVHSRVAGKTVRDFLGSNVIRALPSGLGSAPLNLQVTQTTHSSVTLAWEAGPGETPVRYKIVRQSQRHGGEFAFPLDSDVLKGGATATVVTDLDQTDEFAFKVFAGNFRGFETAGSNVLHGVQPVGVPRALSVRGVSSSSATLDWLPPQHGANPAAYRIEFRVQESVTPIADVVHLGGTSSTQSALVAPLQRQPHTFVVFSRAPNGYYEPRGTAPAVGMPLLVPSMLRVETLSTSSVTLRWTLPGDLPPLPANGTDPDVGTLSTSAFVPESYVLQYQAVGAARAGQVAGISIYTDTWTVTGLETNQRYRFQIQARTPGGGASVLLGTVATNSAVATPMDAAANLTAVMVDATRVDLEWVAPALGLIPSAYALTVTPTATTSTTTAAPRSLFVPHRGAYRTRQAFSVTGLANGVQYRFAVATVAFSGDVGPSAGDVVTTTMAPPTDVAVSAVSAFSISLTWQPAVTGPLDATPSHYVLEFGRDGAATEQRQIPFGSTSITLENLVSGSPYVLCLVAVATSGDVVRPHSACPPATPVGLPSSPRIVEVNFSSIAVQWDPPALGQAPTGYVIEATRIADGHVATLSVGGSGGPWVMSGLAGTEVWSVTVRSVVTGFVHPLGTTPMLVSPVATARRARLCFLTEREVAIQWLAPLFGPDIAAYGVSVRPAGCGAAWWAACDAASPLQRVAHQGSQDDIQRHTIVNLDPGTDVDVRILTQNPTTLLYDPVGTEPILVRPEGGRADFALQLDGQASDSHVMVAKVGDASARDALRTASATVEAWVWLDPGAPLGFQAVAGNAYSYVAQSISSQGAGHVGYGLYCVSSGPSPASPRCGFHVGTLTDPSRQTSLLGLCPSLSFNDASFCGGDPGYTTSHRAESGELVPGQWYHLGGSYSALTGSLVLVVDGELAYATTVSYVAIDGTVQHPDIVYVADGGAYPVSETKPWHRTDWQIGRGLMGDSAATVVTATYAYLLGSVDDVRVWSYGRSAEAMRAEAYLDTVAPGSAGLLGYWPMDDATFGGKCSDELVAVRDASRAAGGGEGRPGVLSGGVRLVVSSVPLDRDGQFSADTPADDAEIQVTVGDEVSLSIAGVDPNPSDLLTLQIQLPSDPLANPTGLTLLNASEQSAVLFWRPLPRDSGKRVRLCLSLVNAPTNPLRPSFSRPGFRTDRCLVLSVPLCQYRAQAGESLRAIAALYQTSWRALFMLNPQLLHPLALEPGTVVQVGSLYRLDGDASLQELSARLRVSWTSIVNNNAALVYRLWSDHTFLEAARRAGAGAGGPIAVLDAGEGVYDVEYQDLEREVNYSTSEVCLVTQFNENCF